MRGALGRGDERGDGGTLARRAQLRTAVPLVSDEGHAEGSVRREGAWTLAGCAAAIIAANVLSALLAAY